MNVVWMPSTAMSPALNHYATEASPKKDAQVPYITQQPLQYTSYRGFISYTCFLSRIMKFSHSIYMDYVSTVVEKDKCHCY